MSTDRDRYINSLDEAIWMGVVEQERLDNTLKMKAIRLVGYLAGVVITFIIFIIVAAVIFS